MQLITASGEKSKLLKSARQIFKSQHDLLGATFQVTYNVVANQYHGWPSETEFQKIVDLSGVSGCSVYVTDEEFLNNPQNTEAWALSRSARYDDFIDYWREYTLYLENMILIFSDASIGIRLVADLDLVITGYKDMPAESHELIFRDDMFMTDDSLKMYLQDYFDKETCSRLPVIVEDNRFANGSSDGI